jgi:hypothetical protein
MSILYTQIKRIYHHNYLLQEEAGCVYFLLADFI